MPATDHRNTLVFGAPPADPAALVRDGGIAVCALSLDRPPDAGWDAWLPNFDEDERSRAGRFHRSEDRAAFIAAHALLRVLLTACAGRGAPAPKEWRFAFGPRGKPCLREGSAPLHFNLSHAEGLVVCVVAKERDVGVDVEPADRNIDWRAMARRVLTAAELRIVETCAPVHQSQAFLRLWTLKEALGKAVGEGLALSFTDVGFDLDPPRLVEATARLGDRRNWFLAQSGAGLRHIVALAARRSEDGDPKLFVWNASSAERRGGASLALTTLAEDGPRPGSRAGGY